MADAIYDAIRIAKLIHDTCISAKNCRSFLGCVGAKIELILHIMEEIENTLESMDSSQAQNVLLSISTLTEDTKAIKELVEKATKMGRIVFIVHSRDVQMQMDRKLSALHITLMGLQTCQNTSMARKIDDFHLAWSERENELRNEADKEMALRSQLSAALLQPATEDTCKSIAELAGIDIKQLHEEMDQLREERDLMRLKAQSASASLNTVARDKAKIEASFMDQMVEALSMESATPVSSLRNSSRGPIPQDCLCPITSEIMDDPVIVDAPCNHTLSREAAVHWFDLGHRKCPVCKTSIKSSRVMPNASLRGIIESIRPYYASNSSGIIETNDNPSSSHHSSEKQSKSSPLMAKDDTKDPAFGDTGFGSWSEHSSGPTLEKNETKPNGLENEPMQPSLVVAREAVQVDPSDVKKPVQKMSSEEELAIANFHSPDIEPLSFSRPAECPSPEPVHASHDHVAINIADSNTNKSKSQSNNKKRVVEQPSSSNRNRWCSIKRILYVAIIVIDVLIAAVEAIVGLTLMKPNNNTEDPIIEPSPLSQDRIDSCNGYCKNGGTCRISGSDPSCFCSTNYSGPRCQDFIDPCDGYCMNGGTCSISGSDAVCKCSSGYSGNRCQTTIKTLDLSCLSRNPTKTKLATGKSYSYFGSSIAVSKDIVVVSAKYENTNGKEDARAAYVYTKDSDDWEQQTKLIPSDVTKNAYFGSSVAINSAGDTIVVGAYFYGTSKPGAAYVFHRTGSSWKQVAKLTGDKSTNDLFGVAVAIDNDTVVVGASNDGSDEEGAAYVFTYDGSKWSRSAKLIAPSTAEEFGYAVDIQGDRIVIGDRWDDKKASDAGAVHVYSRSGSDWTKEATLYASDAADNDYFGRSVALDGDTIVVGADRDNNSKGVDAGAVYVFDRQSSNSWKQTGKLTASDGERYDEFGYSVALQNNVLVVGTGWANKVYVYARSGSTWGSEKKQLTDPSGIGEFVGAAVALDGTTVVVGDLGANSYDGKATIFELC